MRLTMSGSADTVMNALNISQTVQIGKSGCLIMENIVEDNRVPFTVKGVSLGARSGDVLEAIKSVFGEYSRPSVNWSETPPVYNFTRTLREPLRDPEAYIIDTQRKFTRIVIHFQDDAAEEAC
jgi:hypothetical protein